MIGSAVSYFKDITALIVNIMCYLIRSGLALAVAHVALDVLEDACGLLLQRLVARVGERHLGRVLAPRLAHRTCEQRNAIQLTCSQMRLFPRRMSCFASLFS